MISKIGNKIWDGLRRPIIYTAIVAGICTVAQARAYRYFLNQEVESLIAKMPWIILGIYGSLSLYGDLPKAREKANPTLLKLINPIAWNVVIVLLTALSVAIPYFSR